MTDQINQLVRNAREEHAYASEQFMRWFVKEQVEEVATMSSPLAVVERNRDHLANVEECVAREAGRARATRRRHDRGRLSPTWGTLAPCA